MEQKRRLSRFPLHRPFEKIRPDEEIAEIAFRLIVGWMTDEPIIIGTATCICPSLLVTAAHVFDDLISERIEGHSRVIDRSVVAVHIVREADEPEYLVWHVLAGAIDVATDLALLHVSSAPSRSGAPKRYRWKSPRVAMFGPGNGETVAALGFRRGRITAVREADAIAYSVTDEFMQSVGTAREHFTMQRDKVVLPFPCFQVDARFDGGMSGGPVFDETGALCGVVCTGIEGSDEDGGPVSYASMLWPLFRLVVNFRRFDIPEGTQYPLIDLVGAGIIHTDAADVARFLSIMRSSVQTQS